MPNSTNSNDASRRDILFPLIIGESNETNDGTPRNGPLGLVSYPDVDVQLSESLSSTSTCLALLLGGGGGVAGGGGGFWSAAAISKSTLGRVFYSKLAADRLIASEALNQDFQQN
eukprot:GABV01011985.1.p1 GENE.GABV01011985.1~~GABV01011985.1.p1  ORF type:complete len:132 (+),score=19.45 GABV01011985.1:53-397(+)